MMPDDLPKELEPYRPTIKRLVRAGKSHNEIAKALWDAGARLPEHIGHLSTWQYGGNLLRSIIRRAFFAHTYSQNAPSKITQLRARIGRQRDKLRALEELLRKAEKQHEESQKESQV